MNTDTKILAIYTKVNAINAGCDKYGTLRRHQIPETIALMAMESWFEAALDSIYKGIGLKERLEIMECGWASW